MTIAAFLALAWTDAWFWDNDLAPGAGIGARVQRAEVPEVVTAWDAGGYTLCRVWEAPAARVRPAIDGPMVRRFGSVSVSIVDDGDKLVATLQPAHVDLGKLGLTSVDGGEPMVEGSPADAPADTTTVESLAPFPVTVDLHTGDVVTGIVPLPADAWPLIAGLRVRDGHDEAMILDVSGDHTTLRAVACEQDANFRVHNPDDRVVPANRVALGTAAAALLALLARRRLATR